MPCGCGPDRFVVGEMRDGAAALDTLKSWNTGHPGGLSIVHANSAEDALRTIEDLISEVAAVVPRRASGQAVDLIVQINRVPAGRRVEMILAVDGFDGDQYRTAPVLCPPDRGSALWHMAPGYPLRRSRRR